MEILTRHADRIADRIDARVEHADDIARPGLRNDVAVVRHHLLRLGKARLSLSLDMPDFHVRIEMARDNAHERDTVPVILVHVGLDLEDKCRKIMLLRFDQPDIGHAGQRRHRHLKEVLKECLHAEVRQRGSEEHRRKSASADLLLVELRRSPVQKLQLLVQLLLFLRRHEVSDLGRAERDLLDLTFLRAFLGIVENQNLLGAPVVDTLEALS